MDSKFLTIIIPCYKEVDRLPLFLNDLYTQLNHLDINFIIVDDGSPIEDFNKMKNLIDPFLSEKFKLLRYEKNLGKGGAISYGLTHASSDYIGFVDADGSIPFYEIENIANYMKNNYQIDMLIASRILMLGKKIERKFLRHLSGRLFSTMLNAIFPMKVYDSQCGFKIFSKLKYEKINNFITDKRWLWDTQLLILFYISSFNIIEYPVDWKEQPGSKVKIISDSINMFLGLIKFKKKLEDYGFKRI
jgi:dolichyl-phosphate beta-glucosyltransferase